MRSVQTNTANQLWGVGQEPQGKVGSAEGTGVESLYKWEGSSYEGGTDSVMQEDVLGG